jgi:hypothetical protein
VLTSINSAAWRICDLGHIACLHELREIRDGRLVNGSSGDKMVVI